MSAKRSLTATYRLQMNAGFTLTQARARVDYFARLGVSHLYLSPILCSRRGSMHGYDVVDPSRIDPELGTDGHLRALAAEVQSRGMGLIVDIVPNHMGIGPENPQWEDVLTHGERSRFSRWFDIDWSSRKVVLPVLADELDRVLERGDLSVRVHELETPRIRYQQQSFPIDPATLPPELQLATFDAEEAGELAHLFSGKQGRERLRQLLDAQHYRLAFWRRARDEINYRRFFDVNDLAALRIEDDEVFRETHAFILGLVREGIVDGLRVDHVDGLLDPLAYLRRLRDAVSPDTPIFVEKILSPAEELRRSWPVQGTTGYEFLNDLEDLFLLPSGFAAIESSYRRMRRLGSTTFHDIARAGKLSVLAGPLHPDVERLVALLSPIVRASSHRWTPAQLGAAVVELIAALPVYRTYIDGHPAIAAADRAVIETASRDASSHAPELAEQIAFIADVLLDAVPSIDAAARLRFVRRLQQVSGPATAKGVEDTALYVYVPLVSRNEVGGAPDRPLAVAVARLHDANGKRAEAWPLSLITTNTHDTKRSADVRARIDALSEMPEEWERSVRRWRRLNARHRRPVKGRLAPDTNTEYLLYQTLVGLWPAPRPAHRADDLPHRDWLASARDRLTRYMLKAAREAKTRTSWVEPDAAYEAALADFIAVLLEPRDDSPFLTDVSRLGACTAPIGAWNSLSRIAVHLTAPGTPDIYQGDELWNFTLVDPDNRRQVNYDARAAALAELDSMVAPPPLFDDRLKLLVANRLLLLRREHSDLFARGTYIPLSVAGVRARQVFAFARTLGDRAVVTIATRLPGSAGEPPLGRWWGDTRIELPAALSGRGWRSAIILDQMSPCRTLELASCLRTIPVAVLAG